MMRLIQRVRAFAQSTLRSHWIEVDGQRVHFRAASSGGGPASPPGRPVVLVHGLAVSSRYMVPTAGWLSRDHPVFAPDLPGFGRSDDPRRVLSVPDLADALRGWTRAVGLDQPVYLGNSLGCQVVADLAARFPQETGPLVLVGPTIDATERTMPRQVARLIVDTAMQPPDFLAIMAIDFLQAGVRRTAKTFRYALEDRIEEKLPHIPHPVLVVRGSRDPLAPQRWVEELTRLLPRGELRVIRGAGHTPHYTAPLELVEVVCRFLDCADLPHSAAEPRPRRPRARGDPGGDPGRHPPDLRRDEATTSGAQTPQLQVQRGGEADPGEVGEQERAGRSANPPEEDRRQQDREPKGHDLREG